MKIAIIYASKHGTTEKVAGAIAEKLSDPHIVKVFALKKSPNPDISDFDMVILGTPIYAGKASKKMKAFCEKNKPVLLSKKTGLFVCGMHLDAEQREKELKEAYPIDLWNKAKVTEFLGGEFLFDKMNFIERLIIKKMIKINKTVHRILWDAIDDFVEIVQH